MMTFCDTGLMSLNRVSGCGVIGVFLHPDIHITRIVTAKYFIIQILADIILYGFLDNIQNSVVYDKIPSVIPAKAGIHVIAILLDPCYPLSRAQASQG